MKIHDKHLGSAAVAALAWVAVAAPSGEVDPNSLLQGFVEELDFWFVLNFQNRHRWVVGIEVALGDRLALVVSVH